jgi:hypothetical protein
MEEIVFGKKYLLERKVEEAKMKVEVKPAEEEEGRKSLPPKPKGLEG